MKKIISLVMLIVLVSSFTFGVSDVPSSWAEDFVENIKGQGVLDDSFFNGYKDSITRKDFAYLGVKLYENYTGKKADIGEANFQDTSDEWILKAKNTGIVGGYPDGTYKPDNNITRQELAVLFVNIFNASDIEYTQPSEDTFSDDSEIADWAKDSVYIAKANGIINGVGNNTFSPNGTATKEQSLIMFNKGQKSESISTPVPELNDIDIAFENAIEFDNNVIVNVANNGYLIQEGKLPEELRDAVYTLKIPSEYLYSFDNFSSVDSYTNIKEQRKRVGFILSGPISKGVYITLHDKNYTLLGYTYFEEDLKFKNENFYQLSAIFRPTTRVEERFLSHTVDYKVTVEFPSGIRTASGNVNDGGHGTDSDVKVDKDGNAIPELDTLFYDSNLRPIYSPLGKDAIKLEILDSNLYLDKLKIEKFILSEY